MSVSLWRWSEDCEGVPCVGDCDLCNREIIITESKIKKDLNDFKSNANKIIVPKFEPRVKENENLGRS